MHITHVTHVRTRHTHGHARARTFTQCMVTLQLSFVWFTVAISWVLVGLFYLTIYYILIHYLQDNSHVCQFIPVKLGWLQVVIVTRNETR